MRSDRNLSPSAPTTIASLRALAYLSDVCEVDIDRYIC